MDVLWERTGALSRAQRGLRVGAGDVASGRETPVGPRAMEYLLFVLYFSFFLCIMRVEGPTISQVTSSCTVQ